MRGRAILGWLFPEQAERDEGFQQDVLSAAFRGARVLAAVEGVIAAPALAGLMPLAAGAGMLGVGAATFAVTKLARAYPHCRLLAGISACAAAAIAARAILAGASTDYALGAVTFLMMAAVTAVPFRPMQSLAIGGVVTAAGLECGHAWFLATQTLAAVSVSAVLFAQRFTHYRLYVDALRRSAELREYQSQWMRAEGSATMVRLSAALAHELSSPVGALASGIDTLLSVCRRQGQASAEERQRLLGLEAALRGSLAASLERLRKTVNRIQRLTNLDEAGSQEADLNDLVRDAVDLAKTDGPETTRFELELRPLPRIQCRPQQLTAVLCSLLANSIQAVNGDGRIAVTTALRESALELTIEDNGRGIPADRLAHIFDPGFQAADGRVTTGNWSLFTSRQYVRDHGGEIRIRSKEGEGTSVCLTLPSGS